MTNQGEQMGKNSDIRERREKEFVRVENEQLLLDLGEMDCCRPLFPEDEMIDKDPLTGTSWDSLPFR